MKLNKLYIILSIICLFAGIVNLIIPDTVMFKLHHPPLLNNIIISSTIIGELFLGFTVVFWLSGMSSKPQLSTLSRMILANLFILLIFLLIIITGLLDQFGWLVVFIALIISAVVSYFILSNRRKIN